MGERRQGAAAKWIDGEAFKRDGLEREPLEERAGAATANGAGAQGDDGKGERPADNRWMDTKTGREERDRWTGNRESQEKRGI